MDQDARCSTALGHHPALERGILDGFKASCAAVFFITPDYKDQGYLETEIDYAVREKRKKREHFAIIAIVFRDENGREGDVPELLKSYVYKTLNTHLKALREIIRALPVKLGEPGWIE